MCSDAGSGDYKNLKVRSEIGYSRQGESSSSQSGFVLNNILEELISFDEPGNFMDPVDDSFAPNYSKIIKNPMCFLKMREKLCSQKYTTWKTFVEDFERICYNAMVYNQKRSKIWNSANTLLRRGKLYLEEQSSRQKTMFSIYENPSQDSNLIQEQVTSKTEVVYEKAQRDCLVENLLGVPQREQIRAPQRDLASGLFPVGTEDLVAQLREVASSKMCLEGHDNKVSSSAKQQEGSFEKSVGEDVIVEIVEPVPAEDVRLNADNDATECSSSFDGTHTSLSDYEVVDCSSEAVSQLRGGNGANVPLEEGASSMRRKKRALDAEWKATRQDIEWQCRWLELRVKNLHAEYRKYEQLLFMARDCKQPFVDQQEGQGASRTSGLFEKPQKKRILQRRRRRKVEEDINYLPMHPVFSRYEKKMQRSHEQSSADEVVLNGRNQKLELDDLSQETENSEDDLAKEDNSMEQLLWRIDTLQMHVLKLKSQLNRSVPMQRSGKMLTVDVPSSSHKILGDLSSFGYQKSLSGPTMVNSPGRTGTRSTILGLKSSSRRRNVDFDINNVVMPGASMANYVEPVRHSFIDTPHWRLVDSKNIASLPDEDGSSDEDTDDELYKQRHVEMRLKERQQQYTPVSKSRVLTPDSGRLKSFTKGSVRTAQKGFRANLQVAEKAEVPTCFPKRKRTKREPRDIAALAKDIDALLSPVHTTP